jgi:hypothetical protein
MMYCSWHLCMSEVAIETDADVQQRKNSIANALMCLNYVRTAPEHAKLHNCASS